VVASVWFAAIVARDRNNNRAKIILRESEARLVTDHVLVETWMLLARRYRREAAEKFWESIRRGGAEVEPVSPTDFEAAWRIGEMFPDQDFSIVDRTSFAVMERLGIAQVASFDSHFAVYRYGRARDRAFEIVR
jgi:predicted nucleic acid-binding protein